MSTILDVAKLANVSTATVSRVINSPDNVRPKTRERVYRAMRDFMPWRKGPFEVFGTEIDAEWRSERKWNRVLPVLPDLRHKVVADIGSNNGYYMFRMAHHRPRLVMGFEPYLQHYFAFQTLNSFAGCRNLCAELLGVEHVSLFKKSFDAGRPLNRGITGYSR